MPVHGIRLDLEFLALVAGAGIVSFFMTGELVSNVLFTALIGVLFFLIGLHLDIDRVRKNLHQQEELGLGMLMIYVVTPFLAFVVSNIVTGGLSDAFIAIGVSAAAIGSPVVWSNLGKGSGDVALVVSGVSLFAGIAVIPLLLLSFGASIPVLEIAKKNFLFIGAPLVLGVAAKRFENFLFDDLRHHFSKVALWLLVLVMAVQFQILYQSQGLAFLQSIGTGIVLMALFVLVSFGIAYLAALDFTGISEREARALGFSSGSKAIGIALFIAAQLSAEAVAFVSVYFFVRQAVCGAIAEYFRHGELKTVKVMLDRMPV
ncbi:MAG: bile acid:sodium symporter family protein [Candidatus Nanohaloarchaea archaeon]